MKYWFKVETETMEEYKFIPKELENENNIDLALLDAYSVEHKNDLEKIIRNSLDIDTNNRIIISIDYTRNSKNKDFKPYSLVIGNKYLEELLEKENGKLKNLTFGKRNHNGKNVDVRVIYATNESLIDLRKYMLDNINKFSSLLSNNNQFSNMLKEYNRLKNDTYNNEYLNIERKIYDTISEYKIYRNVSMSLYRLSLDKNETKIEEKEETNYLQKYNIENDEYLDENEYLELEGNITKTR